MEGTTATLIAVYNSEGCVGRCDAKCYDARVPECDCVCGGRNHGAGVVQALRNTADLVDPTGELRERVREMGGDHLVLQPTLPLEGQP